MRETLTFRDYRVPFSMEEAMRRIFKRRSTIYYGVTESVKEMLHVELEGQDVLITLVHFSEIDSVHNVEIGVDLVTFQHMTQQEFESLIKLYRKHLTRRMEIDSVLY